MKVKVKSKSVKLWNPDFVGMTSYTCITQHSIKHTVTSILNLSMFTFYLTTSVLYHNLNKSQTNFMFNNELHEFYELFLDRITRLAGLLINGYRLKTIN